LDGREFNSRLGHYPNPKHILPSDIILRRTTFFQPILPLAAHVMCLDSVPRLWRYINLLLTYLSHSGQVNSAFHPSGVGKSSTSPHWLKLRWGVAFVSDGR